MNSKRHDRFLRVASKRTVLVLDAMRKLGQCASPAYEYDQTEIKQIIDAIEGALTDLETQFHRDTTPEVPSFEIKPQRQAAAE